MPTYEYLCEACDHNFDEFQSINDPPLKRCPQCKKPKLRRVFGAGAAIIFKGSGFYQTDYRSESYKAGAKADQEPSKSETAKDGADKTSTNGAADKSGKGSAEKTGKSKEKSSKSTA
jgi:putative FmdB family regulatory protein